MNVQEINDSGRHLSAFVAVAVVLTTLAFLGWALASLYARYARLRTNAQPPAQRSHKWPYGARSYFDGKAYRGAPGRLAVVKTALVSMWKAENDAQMAARAWSYNEKAWNPGSRTGSSTD